MKPMSVGLAEGIFADIANVEFSDKEKIEAIYVMIQKDRMHDVKKEHLMNVIRWMFKRCFVVRKAQKETA